MAAHAPRASVLLLLAASLCFVAPARVSALRNANLTVEIDLSFLNNAFLRELTVVTNGVVEASVIAAAQTIPIPGSLALAQLRWMTTKPNSQVRPPPAACRCGAARKGVVLGRVGQVCTAQHAPGSRAACVLDMAGGGPTRRCTGEVQRHVVHVCDG